MPNTKLFKGAGGGPSSPTTTPDNLFSEDIVEFVLALGEGPIRGLTNGAQDFMVGETPLVSQSGSLNFQKFAVGVYPGYPAGSALPINFYLGGQSSPATSTLPVTLLSGVPVVRQTSAVMRGILQTDGSIAGGIDMLEVRLDFTRLVMSNDGGTYDATAQFKIEYKKAADSTWNNFYSNATISLSGKTSSGYGKMFRVQVPRITNDDWMVRVTKVTADSYQPPLDVITGDFITTQPTGDTVYCDMVWSALNGTTQGDSAFPDTAVIHGIGVASGQFSSIPQFSGVYDGLVIRVPTNYNPDLRTYDDTAPWDGSFKFAWTSNPAWILFDLIVNPRYGLAAYRVFVDTDRYDFYEAARWCDELVYPMAGSTGTPQPRYTFNDIISEPRPIMDLLNYVAGSFNALVWDDLNGQIHLKVDKDDPAVMMFTPENVNEAGFAYTFTDITTRANDISAGFMNPDLDWNEDRRRVTGVTTDEAAITKYGRIPLDFIAVGCTNADEAIRKAKVRLISSQTETTMCSFVTTGQGQLLSLFDIILIADPDMGWSQSGRITTLDTSFLTFRDAIYIETIQSYTVKLQTPDGIQEITVLPDMLGPTNSLAVTSAIPANIPKNTVFTLEQTGAGFGLAKPFRITAIKEADGSPYHYEISCIEINRNKYIDSDSNGLSPPIVYAWKQPSLPGAPLNFAANSDETQILVGDDGSITTRIYASWRKPLGAVVTEFELQWKLLSDNNWQWVTMTETESAYAAPVVKGAHYSLRVRSTDPSGLKSAWATINDHQVKGKTIIPRGLTSFTATADMFQNKVAWTFPATKDNRLVQIWGTTVDNNIAHATLLSELSYPTSNWTHIGLAPGVQVWYWARLQDTSGNYSLYSGPVTATTISDPSKVLAILTGAITESQLYSALNTRINLVDAPGSGLVAQLAVNVVKINGLNAQVYTKIDSNGYITGYGLDSSVDKNGTPTSSFIIKADKFAVVMPGYANKIPFVVGSVNGSTVIGIDGTLMVDGSIAARSINTNGLTIRDTSGNIILGSGNALNYSSYVSGGPPVGATVGATFGVNIGGQITGGNASTYIAAAAIGTALIQDAAISTAKIGDLAVNTLKVAGNAITQTSGASGTSSASVGITCTGGPIQVLAHGTGPTETGSGDTYVQAPTHITVSRDGSNFISAMFTDNFMTLDYPGAGYHTYTITINPSYGTYSAPGPYTFISVLETKR